MSILRVPILVRGRHIWDPQSMPAEELRNRRSAMCALLAARGLDGVFCYADSTCNGYAEYFTNYNCVQPFTNAMFILRTEGNAMLVACVPPRDVQQIRNGFIPPEIEVSAVGMSPMACDHIGQKVAEYLNEKNLAGKRWGGVNLSRCMKKSLDDLEHCVADIVDLTEDFEKMRAVKTTVEIKLISQAAALARKAVLEFASSCREGAEECVIAAKADRVIRYAGAEDIQIFIGTSESGVCLRIPEKRTLKTGETVKILCQVQYLRYRGIFAQTVVVGDKQNSIPQCAKELAASFDSLRGRLRHGEMLDADWQTKTEAGKSTHTTVCGIGQDVIEPLPESFQKNMVLSVLLESGSDCAIYADTVLCTEDGACSLSRNTPEYAGICRNTERRRLS